MTAVATSAQTTLVGREAEIDELAAVIEEARSGSSTALVLRGEAGVGKTLLLGHVIAMAEDFELVHVDGIESEVQLGYAALHRILLTSLDRIDNLPIPQREALEAALGTRASGPPDPFLVGLAALSLLGDTERTSPLLVVVDDAQWLDPDSVMALGCVGRRLHSDRMALICVMRDPVEQQFSQFQGWRELRLEGLPEDSARRLLLSLAKTPVHEAVADALIGAAGGNPLALLEITEELAPSQLVGLSPLPNPLPIGPLMEARFASRAKALPRDTRLALLLVAAEPSEDPTIIRRAMVGLGISIAALEPAESDQLVRADHRIRFLHPLVRSAVYSGASPADRRRVHEALASATDPEADGERWALHRALAAIGPDEEIAMALEISAIRARTRGGYSAESSLLVRAAELTPELDQRSNRLLSAAQAAHNAGNLSLAKGLLNEARAGELDQVATAQAQFLDGMVSMHLGMAGPSPALLQKAAEAFAPFDQEMAHRALLAAFLALTSADHLSEGATGRDVGEAALKSLALGESNSTIDILLQAIASAYACDYEDAVPALRRAVSHFDQLSLQDIVEWYFVANVIAIELLDAEASVILTQRLESAARDGGAVHCLHHALLLSGIREVWEGKFSAASERSAELVEIVKARGYLREDFAAVVDVELCAWRGDEDNARVKIAALIEGGNAIGSGAVVLTAHMAAATLELGLGNYSEAMAAAQAMHEADAMNRRWWPLVFLVEAGVKCGDLSAAEQALHELELRANVAQTPLALGMWSFCRAQVADNPDVVSASFLEAIERFEDLDWRTYVGRAHLRYGEWLRRHKRRTEAGAELRAAYETFESIGARAFAERSRLELLAIGVRTKEQESNTKSDLTPRELQVARLAAARLTSREIASQLFISPHTVEYHLKKVFQKVSVGSRRELATAIEGL